jgi:hypothetical protein
MPVLEPSQEGQGTSICTIQSEQGLGVTLWSLPQSTTKTATKHGVQFQIELAPDHSIVIGRCHGGQVPYLDPRFVATPLIPGSDEIILRRAGRGEDRLVSRAHLLLRGQRAGLVLINGVPGRGGGIRAPLNGTVLISPEHRWLGLGEEYLISHGGAATVRLPNGTQFTLRIE